MNSMTARGSRLCLVLLGIGLVCSCAAAASLQGANGSTQAAGDAGNSTQGGITPSAADSDSAVTEPTAEGVGVARLHQKGSAGDKPKGAKQKHSRHGKDGHRSHDSSIDKHAHRHGRNHLPKHSHHRQRPGDYRGPHEPHPPASQHDHSYEYEGPHEYEPHPEYQFSQRYPDQEPDRYPGEPPERRYYRSDPLAEGDNRAQQPEPSRVPRTTPQPAKQGGGSSSGRQQPKEQQQQPQQKQQQPARSTPAPARSPPRSLPQPTPAPQQPQQPKAKPPPGLQEPDTLVGESPSVPRPGRNTGSGQQREQLPDLTSPDFEHQEVWEGRPEPPSDGRESRPGRKQLPDLTSPDFEHPEVWEGRRESPSDESSSESHPERNTGSGQQRKQLPDLTSPDFEHPGVWEGRPQPPSAKVKAPLGGQPQPKPKPAQEPGLSRSQPQPHQQQQQQGAPRKAPEQPAGSKGPETHAPKLLEPVQKAPDSQPPQAKAPQHRVLEVPPSKSPVQTELPQGQGRAQQKPPQPQQQQQQQQQQQDPKQPATGGTPVVLPGNSTQPRGNASPPAKQLPGGYGGFGYGGYGGGYGLPDKRISKDAPDAAAGPKPSPNSSSSSNSTHPVKRLPGDEGFDVQDELLLDDEEFPDPTASQPLPDDADSDSKPAKRLPGYGYWPVYAPPAEDRADEGYWPAPAERRFGDPAPGEKETPRVLNGSCKAGGAESNCQGSGVIIDDSARVSDGVVTAIADCVEEAGNILQKGGFCDLVCTDQADYKVVQKTNTTLKTGYDGQILCEAKRVTDSVPINGICSLIPVATCCEPENPDEGLVFVRSLQAGRRQEKQLLKPQYNL